jgi:hypothetical protein
MRKSFHEESRSNRAKQCPPQRTFISNGAPGVSKGVHETRNDVAVSVNDVPACGTQEACGAMKSADRAATCPVRRTAEPYRTTMSPVTARRRRAASRSRRVTQRRLRSVYRSSREAAFCRRQPVYVVGASFCGTVRQESVRLRRRSVAGSGLLEPFTSSVHPLPQNEPIACHPERSARSARSEGPAFESTRGAGHLPRGARDLLLRAHAERWTS